MRETSSIALRLGFNRVWTNFNTPAPYYSQIHTLQVYLVAFSKIIREDNDIRILNVKFFITRNNHILLAYTNYVLAYHKREMEKEDRRLTTSKFIKQTFRFIVPYAYRFYCKTGTLPIFTYSPERLERSILSYLKLSQESSPTIRFNRYQERSGHVAYGLKNSKLLRIRLYRDYYRRYLDRLQETKKRTTTQNDLASYQHILARQRSDKKHLLWPFYRSTRLYDLKAAQSRVQLWRKKQSISRVFRVKIAIVKPKLTVTQPSMGRSWESLIKPNTNLLQQPTVLPIRNLLYRRLLYVNLLRVSIEVLLQRFRQTSVTVLTNSLWNEFVNGWADYRAIHLLTKVYSRFGDNFQKQRHVYDRITLGCYSLVHKDAETLVNYLTYELARTRFHRSMMYLFTKQVLFSLIEVFGGEAIKKNHDPYLVVNGFSFARYGTIGKHGRTKKMRYTYGTKTRNTFRSYIYDAFNSANTFYGTLGLHVWLI